jgi:hypothetical protein
VSTVLQDIGLGLSGKTAITTVYRPWTPQQTYLFYGSLTNVAQVASFEFYVLAGDGAPTITAGFVKLNVIDRPQRVGFTVPAGYDPITMDVPIQFESWVRQPADKSAIQHVGSISQALTTNQVPDNVEADIQKLEWMAGRGKLYASPPDLGVGSPATGDPPLVTVRSIDGTGSETNLIPPNLHGLEWIVSSIAYDTNPLRDRLGNRRRQAATVTLTQFIAAAGSGLDSPTTRAKARNTQTHYQRPVVTTAAVNTIGLITETYVFNPTWQAKLAVLALNKKLGVGGVHIRSVNQTLPVGTIIQIPATLTIAAP